MRKIDKACRGKQPEVFVQRRCVAPKIEAQPSHTLSELAFSHCEVRRAIRYEVTLREDPEDTNGARIHDTRNEGCLVEMLGKKKWVGHQHYDPLVQRWPHGDAKLYHLSRHRITAEPDEDNRELRKKKQTRTDTHISESREPLRLRTKDSGTSRGKMEVIPKLTSATLDLQATCKDATEQEGRTLQDEDHPKPSAQMFSFARARLPQTAAVVQEAWQCMLPGSRAFGTKRVRQRRRSRGRIIQLKETHYEPKPEGYQSLPMSLLASGPIRRVLSTRSAEAGRLAGAIDWERYKCDVKGVRWHASGAWRVLFNKKDYEHNFFVKCSCYFRVPIYGFDRAKELAIAYRRRLESEWDEQLRIWADLDEKREQQRAARRAERALMMEQQDPAERSIYGTEDEPTASLEAPKPDRTLR
ncbi:unnamed protein product [Symbiodinium necroappetens]|uniref:AP2/ERF domain-containing protein n=1 Tax=Symbiodinium necroappetens TaxID=1628268 RepID=A0A813BRF8_9DINO|nr:unnamed protein product [Symbiodinium necroappetens]